MTDRTEAPTVRRHLTGAGDFTADRQRPGDLVMAVLRSPVAHGVIRTLTVPEEVDAILPTDLAAEGIGPLTSRAAITGEDGPMIEPRREVLARDRVRYVGEPLAAVLAETEADALAALEEIELDIDPLPTVTRPGEPDPQIWPEAPANRAFAWSCGNAEETDGLIAGAAHVIELEMGHPRIAISPIEPRACIAEPGERLTLTTPSQGVFGLRTALAACLGIAPGELRVLTPDVGGSFAVKIWPYPEHVLALMAARRAGRRVVWTGTRSESFSADIQGRARQDRGTLALDTEGRFLAFRIVASADMGAYLGLAAPSVVTTGAVRPFAQLYAIPGQHYRVEAVFTNAVPTDAYRGAGKPETTAVLERLIDLAAARLGMDRLEIRRRNLIRPGAFPLTTPMGETMDAGDFPALAAHIAPAWEGLAARKDESRARGLLRGAGIGFHCHATGGSTAEQSLVRALPDGTIEVLTGLQDNGQGHARALARVAAEALDLPPERIRVRQGDSDRLEKGGGTGGSNLLPVAGPTVARAAAAMLEAARETAAHLLEAALADIDYGGGEFRITGTDRTLGLARIAAAHETDDLPGGCLGIREFEGVHTTWPNGVYLAEVEVDPETGETRLDRFQGLSDIGRVIDEPSALGQIHGGIAQSLGEAAMESMVFDGDGQPLTGSLMDYALPRAADLPFYALEWTRTDSPNHPLGTKGVGELASIGAPAVIVNAVLDALAPLGVRHLDKPLTPGRVWQAIQDAGPT